MISGNVGIGTTTPSEALDISGNVRLGKAPATLTTVSIGFNPTATTASVVSTTDYPSTGTLFIDSEAMTYTGVTATTFTGLGRGALGTTAATHAIGAIVDNYLFIATKTTAIPTLAMTGNGNIILAAGSKIHPPANSTTALNIAQADGTNYVTFNSTNKRVGIGIGVSNPSVTADIGGDLKATNATISGSTSTGGLTITGLGTTYFPRLSANYQGDGSTNEYAASLYGELMNISVVSTTTGGVLGQGTFYGILANVTGKVIGGDFFGRVMLDPSLGTLSLSELIGVRGRIDTEDFYGSYGSTLVDIPKAISVKAEGVADTGLLLNTVTAYNFYGAAHTAGTNRYGLWLEKQSGGTINSGIILNGDGVGADIALGLGQKAKIYYSTDLIIDPDVVGTGGVRIGGKLINDSTMRLKGYTVATLPAGIQGDTAFVTDALAPAYLTAVVGGGAVVTPAFYNGTNWVAH